MIRLDITVRGKYYKLKDELDETRRIFNNNATEANSIAYEAAKKQFEDFCIAYVARMAGDDELAFCYQEC